MAAILKIRSTSMYRFALFRNLSSPAGKGSLFEGAGTEGGVAAFVETAGASLALLAALPLVRAVAQTMGELLS